MDFRGGFSIPQPDEFNLDGFWGPANPEPSPRLGLESWPQQVGPSYNELAQIFSNASSQVVGLPQQQTLPGNCSDGGGGDLDWNNMPLMQLLLQSNDSNFAVSRDSRIRPPVMPNSSFGQNLSFGPEFSDAHCRIEQQQQVQSLVSVPEISLQYDFATPSKPCYDLNLSPAMNPSHFTPLTPDPVPKHQSSEISVRSSVGEGQIQQSFTQLLQNIVDSSSSSSTLISMPVKEKDDSENRTELVIDLNETPQQKPPKRRKHRPKVVREGKPKRIPKEKTEPSSENRPAKRKYVRKKISQEPNTVTEEEAKRSCKRALNFDLEEIPQEVETETGTGTGNRNGSNITIHLQGLDHNNGTGTIPNQMGMSMNQTSNGHVSSLREQSGNRQTVAGPIGPANGVEIGLKGVRGKGSTERSNEVDLVELQMIKELMQNAFQQIPKTPSKSTEARGSKRDHSSTNHMGELRKTDHSMSTKEQVGEARLPHRVNLIAHSLNAHLEKTGLSESKNNTAHHIGSVHSTSNLHIAETHSFNGSKGSVHNSLLNFSGQGHAQMFQISQTVPDLSQVSKPKKQAPKKKGPKTKSAFPTLIDEIIHRLQVLNLDGGGDRSQQNDQNALVLYKGGGTLILYEGVDLVKKRKPRPKVDLDSETSRMWNLLIGHEGSENVEENDEKKEKWWEEERKVFRGRVDSFIARMHLVQGDRRFSRWKGSVVDSVIGVFLTQNVSDHLSSSAFMSMAARFPLKARTQEEAKTNMIDIEAPIAEINPDEAIKWYEAPTEPTKIPEEECILSQDSFDSSITQLAGGIRSCSGSNSETDDPSDGLKVGAGQVSGFTDYLSTQNKSSSVQEVCSQEKGYLSSTSQISEVWLSEKASQVPEALSKGSRTGEDSRSFGLWWSHETPETIDPFALSGIKTSNQLQIPLTEPATGYSQSSIQPGNIAESLDRAKKVASLGVNELAGKIFEAGDCSSVVNTQIQIKVSPNKKNSNALKVKSESAKKSSVDWDELRKKAESDGKKKERMRESMDSLDYEEVRTADVKVISDCIKERGMNNMLAERMKEFLNRVVRDHGSIDLEWLRDVPPDKAKDYLLSVRGLGLKSVECVRLLTLHHLAFPVDTNVGRIAVRLGWVPLQPLPESLQLHLLELYPILESIQKYLWPRLCKLDQRTLYELHYQMITFGKVFCTKSKPNCNACPMRGECRHFASAFASARLALPGPEERSIVASNAPQTAEDNTNNNHMDNNSSNNNNNDTNPGVIIHPMSLPPPEQNNSVLEVGSSCRTCEPIIEEPATPEQECLEILESDIEDYEDPNEIPTIELDITEFKENLQNYMQTNMELQEADMSKALVALNPDVASIPIPKLKNVSRLRTEHQVYELPDSHPLLERLERREADDPSPYLLAIWTPGETANSIQPTEKSCGSEPDKLCGNVTCFSCNSVREANSQTVRGTILIPCRTAMRGSFPLNGTYFQVNEMFAEHESSLNPINVPREWIWNLPRRMVYFGTSVSTIFKGLTTEGIQYCFWRGFVCVRGFDLVTRAPRPLMARLHFPASKLARGKNNNKK